MPFCSGAAVDDPDANGHAHPGDGPPHVVSVKVVGHVHSRPLTQAKNRQPPRQLHARRPWTTYPVIFFAEAMQICRGQQSRGSAVRDPSNPFLFLVVTGGRRNPSP